MSSITQEINNINSGKEDLKNTLIDQLDIDPNEFLTPAGKTKRLSEWSDIVTRAVGASKNRPVITAVIFHDPYLDIQKSIIELQCSLLVSEGGNSNFAASLNDIVPYVHQNVEYTNFDASYTIDFDFHVLVTDLSVSQVFEFACFKNVTFIKDPLTEAISFIVEGPINMQEYKYVRIEAIQSDNLICTATLYKEDFNNIAKYIGKADNYTVGSLSRYGDINQNNTSYVYSDFIKVAGGTTIVWHSGFSGSGSYLCEYDESDNILAVHQGAYTTSITLNSNCYKIRASFRNDSMLLEGDYGIVQGDIYIYTPSKGTGLARAITVGTSLKIALSTNTILEATDETITVGPKKFIELGTNSVMIGTKAGKVMIGNEAQQVLIGQEAGQVLIGNVAYEIKIGSSAHKIEIGVDPAPQIYIGTAGSEIFIGGHPYSPSSGDSYDSCDCACAGQGGLSYETFNNGPWDFGMQIGSALIIKSDNMNDYGSISVSCAELGTCLYITDYSQTAERGFELNYGPTNYYITNTFRVLYDMKNQLVKIHLPQVGTVLVSALGVE